MDIRLPAKTKGRRTKDQEQRYFDELSRFCGGIKELESRLDFRVSSRGWCYILEEYGLTKGDFDRAQRIINECRKNGMLPIDICAEDDNRSADGRVVYFTDDPAEKLAAEEIGYIQQKDFINDYIRDIADVYKPFHFMDFQDYYIEVLVEKIDLKGIFGPVCRDYGVPYANSKGWADINSRALLMRRFKEWEERGKKCVLLYCGDHDPGGLIIGDAIKSNLYDLSEAVGWRPDNLIIDRFGLNADFIEQHNLSWIDNLETSSKKRLDDPRHHDHEKDYVQNYLQRFGARKVEANALVTRVEAGRDLCRQAILKYFEPEGLDQYREETGRMRQQLFNMINSGLQRQ